MEKLVVLILILASSSLNIFHNQKFFDQEKNRLMALASDLKRVYVSMNEYIHTKDNWSSPLPSISYKNPFEDEDFIYIAHRGGNYSKPNSLEAVISTQKKGYRFYEIDFLIAGEDLLCLGNYRKLCTIKEVLDTLKESQFLIVDLKGSSFAQTERILPRKIKQLVTNNKTIFQLYSEEDVQTFAEITGNLERDSVVNMPIITLYKSKSSVGKAIHELPPQMQLITVPFTRVAEASFSARTLQIKRKILTHPVNKCSSLITLPQEISGIYGENHMTNCKKYF